jgi:hypothetical protein
MIGIGQQADLVDMLEGMRAAEEAANNDQPGWSERALDELLEVGRNLGRFTIEQLREASTLESPTDERAWGGVIQRASRAGLIARCGFAPAKSSNGSPKPVWRVV